jgi:hypothetical protein
VAKQRPRHPKKEIEEALAYAERHGWRVVKSTGKGHAWGRVICPWNDRECRCGNYCQTSVWGTPDVPEHEANKIRRVINGCVRRMGEEIGEPGSQPKERGGSDD